MIATPLPERDWETCPAIATLPPAGPLFVLGDVHGDYPSMRHLLVTAGVIDLAEGAEPKTASWTAGKATLLLLGDTTSKKDAPPRYDTTRVLSLILHLREAAAAAGGRVEAVMGNHEAEFLINPGDKKVSGIVRDLQEANPPIRPVEDVQVGQHPFGVFWRCRPLATAAPGGWFFAHAGDPGGGLLDGYRRLDELAEEIQFAVDAAQQYDVPVLIDRKADKDKNRGLLEGRITKNDSWWGKSKTSTYAEGKELFALVLAGLSTDDFKVEHVMIGHKPGKVRFDLKSEESHFRARGTAFMAFGGAFFMADGAMADTDKARDGFLIRMSQAGDTVHVICPDGDAEGTRLWPDPDHPETHGVSCP